MADYFKPRRGTLASATNKLVGENALRTGELFFELEYKEGTKEVKSGKIKIGGDRKDYANLNYVFDPDAYLELTDTFKVDQSSSSDVSTNVGVINSTNTNITEKFGATSKALSLLNSRLSSHNHTTAQITDLSNTIKATKVNNATNADTAVYARYAYNIRTVSLDEQINYLYDITFNQTKGRTGYIIQNFTDVAKLYRNKLVIINGRFDSRTSTQFKSFQSVFIMTFCIGTSYEHDNRTYPLFIPLDNNTVYNDGGGIANIQYLYPLHDDNDVGEDFYIKFYLDTSNGKISLELQVEMETSKPIGNYTGRAYCAMYDFAII